MTLPLGTIVHGDALEVLRGWPDASVQCCVTSPPYWGLRNYQAEGETLAGQYGQEPTIEEHIAVLVEFFREVRRVLRPDGTLWLNVGDKYAGGGNGGGGSFAKDGIRTGLPGTDKNKRTVHGKMSVPDGFKPKNLLMLPARLAMALQADGWTLRSDIIWSKPNPMPESVTDRPATAHEHVFLLTPGPRYFYDAEAVREEGAGTPTTKMPDGWDTGPGAHGSVHREGREKGAKTDKQRGHSRRHAGFNDRWDEMTRAEQQSSGRNLRNVWTVPTQPYAGAHYATFPEALVEPCIAAGTSERGACPACGAPWRRVVEKIAFGKAPSATGYDDTTKACPLSRSRQAYRAAGLEAAPAPRTTGWVPGCDCPGLDGDGPWSDLSAHPDGTDNWPRVPCIVMDPFAGSGTAGVVAYKMGREFVGIDLAGGDACIGARVDVPRIDEKKNEGRIIAEHTVPCTAPGTSTPTHTVSEWEDKDGMVHMERVDCHTAHNRINAAREGGRSVAEHVGHQEAGQLNILGDGHV